MQGEIAIEITSPERARVFWSAHERDALSELYDFRVVWHEQVYEIVARGDEEIVGALRLRVAASLARVELVMVTPAHRRRGIGRRLLQRAEELANYYNCHKIHLEVPAQGAPRSFVEACGFKVEAILLQHTFKLDMAIMRKFLL